MAHKIEWIEEPWIMRVTYWEKMTVEDIEAVMSVCIAAVDQHPVNFLCDFTGVNFQESALFKSKALIKLFRHPNTKWFSFVGLTSLMHAGARALMGRSTFKSFKTEKEALDFLHLKAEQQKADAARMPSAAKLA